MRVVMLLWLACGCARFQDQSLIDVADSASAPQLLEGFYEIESDFRWTHPSFKVRLKPLPGGKDARLIVSLYVPEALILARHDTTLACSVDGTTLAPQLYDKAGAQELLRDLPPPGAQAPVLACTLSHPLPPGPVDKRELGIVISKIRLLRR